MESIKVHKPARAIVLIIKRLFRCRPFGPMGYDPVPLTPKIELVGQSLKEAVDGRE